MTSAFAQLCLGHGVALHHLADITQNSAVMHVLGRRDAASDNNVPFFCLANEKYTALARECM
jgi:hypothetical protein